MSGPFSRSFRRSSVLRLFAQRKCPIHVRQFAVSTTVPQRFGKKRPPGALFRLAPINLQLGLHGSAPVQLVRVQRAGAVTVPGSRRSNPRARQAACCPAWRWLDANHGSRRAGGAEASDVKGAAQVVRTRSCQVRHRDLTAVQGSRERIARTRTPRPRGGERGCAISRRARIPYK
jgi:hypothetical protein